MKAAAASPATARRAIALGTSRTKKPSSMATPVAEAQIASTFQRPYRLPSRPIRIAPSPSPPSSTPSTSDASAMVIPSTTRAKMKMKGRIPSTAPVHRALATRNQRTAGRAAKRFQKEPFVPPSPCRSPSGSQRRADRSSGAATTVSQVLASTSAAATRKGSGSHSANRSPPPMRPKASPPAWKAPRTPCTGARRSSGTASIISAHSGVVWPCRAAKKRNAPAAGSQKPSRKGVTMRAAAITGAVIHRKRARRP